MASPNELSFLPDDYLERKAQRRTNVICALLFFVVMIAIGTAFTFTERLGRDIEREHAEVWQKYSEAAKRIQLKQELEVKQATMEKQAELSASLLEKVPRSYLLGQITNSLPLGVSLLDFSMESKPRTNSSPNSSQAAAGKTAFEQKRAASDPKAAAAKPVQQAKTYDVFLRIVGVSNDNVQVAMLIGKLNQLKLFKDVNLVVSDEFRDGDAQLRKFQLEAVLDPDAEVTPEPEKTRTAAIEVKPY